MAFFTAIKDQMKRVAKGNQSINKITKLALQANATQIADHNRDQLLSGLDSDGKDLGTYANIKYKNRLRPVDLKLTGDFHKSIKPKFGSESMEMEATDPKTDELQDKYGDEVLGLSQDSLNETADDIKGQVQFELKKIVL